MTQIRWRGVFPALMIKLSGAAADAGAAEFMLLPPLRFASGP